MAVRDRLLNVEDVAEYLGVPVQTIYQWRSKGTGPVGFRVGRHVRYDADEVDRWLRTHADQPRTT